MEKTKACQGKEKKAAECKLAKRLNLKPVNNTKGSFRRPVQSFQGAEYSPTKMRLLPGKGTARFGARFSKKRRGKGPETIATMGLKVRAGERVHGRYGTLMHAEQMLALLNFKGRRENPRGARRPRAMPVSH